jgi:co-chaperonin GroES (HSP10)
MELKSIHSSQKSFYKKANVITEGKETSLRSYKTIVAVKVGNTIKVNGWYSVTTAIHINEFILQSGGQRKLSKKELNLTPTIIL